MKTTMKRGNLYNLDEYRKRAKGKNKRRTYLDHKVTRNQTSTNQASTNQTTQPKIVKLTQAEVDAIFKKRFPKASMYEKIELKAWVYDSQCLTEGGRLALPFHIYRKKQSPVHYLNLVKKYCIEISAIGSYNCVIKCISNKIFEKD